jgi:hypothetical protein
LAVKIPQPALFADNKGMEKQQRELQSFIEAAWARSSTHKEGESIPNEEFLLFTDKNGIRHVETAQKIRHVYKHHGNERAEKARGQIAITQDDFRLVPDIINNYTFAIKNFAHYGKKAILYAKQGEHNTYVYIENISNKWRKNTIATFYNLHRKQDAKALLKTIIANAHSKADNAEIIIGVGGGGNPTDTTQNEPRRTAANSVIPPDTPLSDNPANLSTPTRKPEPQAEIT